MPKQGEKKNSLPPLQKLIIKHLAEKGQRTINETAQEIKHHYKPSWVAFGSLEKKGLIGKVSVKTHRGREYPQFWLTEEGIALALAHEANPNKLQNIIYEKLPAFSYENQDIIDFLCEYAETQKEKLYEIYTALKVVKKSSNRILAKEIFRIIMNNETTCKLFEEHFNFRKRVLEGVTP